MHLTHSYKHRAEQTDTPAATHQAQTTTTPHNNNDLNVFFPPPPISKNEQIPKQRSTRYSDSIHHTSHVTTTRGALAWQPQQQGGEEERERHTGRSTSYIFTSCKSLMDIIMRWRDQEPRVFTHTHTSTMPYWSPAHIHTHTHSLSCKAMVVPIQITSRCLSMR